MCNEVKGLSIWYQFSVLRGTYAARNSMGHFFSDTSFLKKHPYLFPSSWLAEKTPGCQERYRYSLRAPRNRSDPRFFLLVQMYFTILEQFTFQTTSSWEICAEWPTSCKHKLYMDLSDSACAPRFPCVSAVFRCHTISWVHRSESNWAHSAQTYYQGLERTWQFGTPHETHHPGRIMRTYQTHFGLPLGIAPGGWDDRKRHHKLVLPLYLCLDISIFPTISAVHFLAFAFLAITFWSKECVITGLLEGLMSSGFVTNVTGTLFRIRNTISWTVCMNILSAFALNTASLSSHLSIRMAQPTRLRTSLNQPDVSSVAYFVAECLALFPWFILRLYGLVTGFSQASAQMPPRGIYSNVTLPYLTYVFFCKPVDVVEGISLRACCFDGGVCKVGVGGGWLFSKGVKGLSPLINPYDFGCRSDWKKAKNSWVLWPATPRLWSWFLV